MIDYFFKFTNEAAALADAEGTAFYRDGAWNTDRVIPDVKVWRASQDVDGVHTYLAGWFCIVSINREMPALLSHASLQLALSRGKLNRREAGGVLVRNVSLALLADIRFEPVFAGADYPFGAMN